MKHALLAALALPVCTSAWAQEREAPIADTEDASLGSIRVGGGRLHVAATLDVRNGDFVRGSFDDDPASLEQVPVHVQAGLVQELARDADGQGSAWLMVRSSNGFHAPTGRERTSPRGWYESNNLIGVAARLGPDLTGGIVYAIKASPNGVAGTTHELSGTMSLSGDTGLAGFNPGLVATWRPQGGGGLYTQATLEPGWDLGRPGRGPRLSLPMAIGVGWNGFYEPGTGTRLFGSAGVALTMPMVTPALLARAEAMALVRDDLLRQLGGPRSDTAMVVPYVTLAISYSY